MASVLKHSNSSGECNGGFSRWPAHRRSSCSNRFIRQRWVIKALDHQAMSILISFGIELIDAIGSRLVRSRKVCFP